MRYITRPKADWDDPPVVADVSTRIVIIDDDAPVNTGILDASGTPLYRVRDRVPFGFVKG